MTVRALVAILILLVATKATAVTVTVTVGDGGNFFSPAWFVINPGDTVKWVWVSGHHNTSSVSVPAGATGWYSNIDAGTLTYSYVATVSGLYQYTCTHHSGMDGQLFVTGCSYPAKPVIASTNGSTACEGDTIVLTTTPQAGATYQWMNGITAIAGATSAFCTATTSGTYKVQVNRCGSDSVSQPFAVAMHPLPAPSFTYTAKGLAYTFTNTTTPAAGNDYTWYFGDGSPPATSLHATHSYAVPGIYTARLTAIATATQCADSVQQWVEPSVGMHDVDINHILVYPNPAGTVVDVYTESNTPPGMYNIQGNILPVPVTTTGGAYRLDVSTLPAGLYILKMVSGSEPVIRKVLVQH